jgi:hypothetical protein
LRDQIRDLENRELELREPRSMAGADL